MSISYTPSPKAVRVKETLINGAITTFAGLVTYQEKMRIGGLIILVVVFAGKVIQCIINKEDEEELERVMLRMITSVAGMYVIPNVVFGLGRYIMK